MSSDTTGGAKPIRLRPRRECPICKAPAKQKYHPFCSGRCADVDLHRWLGGTYAIPAEDPPDFEDGAGRDEGEHP
ncbi:MAG: DNA gyrase inhibitor YacG [Rhizobiales bacterium]|nr:DNA gyrase inhibitor YacG [Hyphomicrobiales bacterium]